MSILFCDALHRPFIPAYIFKGEAHLIALHYPALEVPAGSYHLPRLQQKQSRQDPQPGPLLRSIAISAIHLHSAKSFPYIIPFHLKNNLPRVDIIISILNVCSERLDNLFKVTQLVCSRAWSFELERQCFRSLYSCPNFLSLFILSP